MDVLNHDPQINRSHIDFSILAHVSSVTTWSFKFPNQLIALPTAAKEISHTYLLCRRVVTVDPVLIEPLLPPFLEHWSPEKNN